MYLQTGHEDDSFHTTQMIPPEITIHMSKGNSCTTRELSSSRAGKGKGWKNNTFPYDTSIHQYFGGLETRTHP